jgi:hypothetical protein
MPRIKRSNTKVCNRPAKSRRAEASCPNVAYRVRPGYLGHSACRHAISGGPQNPEGRKGKLLGGEKSFTYLVCSRSKPQVPMIESGVGRRGLPGSKCGVVRGDPARHLLQRAKVLGANIYENRTLDRINGDDHTGTRSAAQEYSRKAAQGSRMY